MKIQANTIDLVNIELIKTHPKNPNVHPPEQIKRLKQIIKHQGFRTPLVVSKQTGLLIAGHGRLLAAKELGFKQLPVIHEDFDSEADEYAHMTADNALQTWSELDFASINFEIAEFGPELDIELLGLKDFKVDVADKEQEPSVSFKDSWRLEIEFKTEEECSKAFEKLNDEGFNVKIINI